MDMKLPFSTTGMMLHLDDSMDYEVLQSFPNLQKEKKM